MCYKWEATGNSRCPQCEKPYTYVGDVPLGGFIKGQEPYCICNEQTVFVSYGWICPVCGRVNSPYINTCPCHSPIIDYSI